MRCAGTQSSLPARRRQKIADQVRLRPSRSLQSDASPLPKDEAAPGSNTVFQNVTKVDGTQPTISFAQAVLGGTVTAKAALETLQKELEAGA